MTDRELDEKLLEALAHLNRTGDTQVFDLCYAPELIPALQARLAREEQEPFGYFRYDLRLDAWVQNREDTRGTPFYTAPQPACPYIRSSKEGTHWCALANGK